MNKGLRPKSKDKVTPTLKELWLIVEKLVKENDKLKSKVEVLERVVNKDIKKINMIEWLNENVKNGIELEVWLKSNVIVNMEDLKTIFRTDYMRGLSIIVENNFNSQDIPFKAFTHKVRQLYIYHKGKWKKCMKSDLMKIFDRIQLNILKKSKEYDNSLTHEQKYGSNNLEYLKNNDKIMIVDSKKKERYARYIESSIISLIKINLNDMAKYKFYI